MRVSRIEPVVVEDIERAVGHCHGGLTPGRTAAWLMADAVPSRLVVVQELRDEAAMNRRDIATAVGRTVAASGAETYRIVFVRNGSLPTDGGDAVSRDATRHAYLDGRLVIVDELSGDDGGPLTAPADAVRAASTEEVLATICSEMLDVTMAPHDRFIDFTDSLSAVEYVNRIHERFKVDIPATALFEKASSLAKLGELIDQLTAVGSRSEPSAPPDVARPDEAAAVLSTQDRLARLWQELSDGDIGAQDRFIDFTDSLSATEYVNRVREAFNVDIPATALFDRIPSVAKLAEFIETATGPAITASAAPREEPLPLDDCACLLPGGQWRVWKSVAVRGAGFPVSMVRDLAGDDVSAAADVYVAARREVIQRRKLAAHDLGELIKAAATPTARSTLRAVRRKLGHDVVRAADAIPSEKELAAALARREAASTALARAYQAHGDRTHATISRLLLTDRRFREALLWQNRKALSSTARRLGDGHGSTGDRRNAAVFVGMLAQRYATKNDSLGFFGPVGWATLIDEPVAVDVRPGSTLLARREVYFEGWAIDTLAASLDQRFSLKPWSTPRVKAGVWKAADAVHAPLLGSVTLARAEREVLDHCDGARTATDIATIVLNQPDAVASSEAEVFAILERLVDLKLVSWQFEVASQLHPETDLALRIARIGDPAVRAACETALRELTEARTVLAQSAGDDRAVEAALEALDATFVRLTGSSAFRRAGEMYAGRALVFEDCRRDCEVTFGREFLRRLGPPLSIVLDATRWVSTQLRSEFGDYLRACHRTLREKLGADRVDAHLFLNYVGAGAREAIAPMSRTIRRRLQERWQTILEVPEGARSVTRDVAAIQTRAREAFAASGPGSWCGYYTPDIMIAADGLDAFRRGDFHCVLGEVHSNNTLLWSALTSQHPDVAALAAALARDTQGETVVTMQTPKARWLSRLNPTFLESFWRYEHGDDLPSRPACRSLPAALLEAVDDDGTVTIVAKDGRVEFDAYELFAVTMSYEADRIVSDSQPSGSHAPRITIGDLTIARERWQISTSEMPFLTERERSVLFARVRGWARDLGMPRHVFYKSPGETKPCYLDFDSPLYVEIFTKLMRRLRSTATVRIVEMLPGCADTWLVDRDHTRYTSELRIVAHVND